MNLSTFRKEMSDPDRIQRSVSHPGNDQSVTCRATGIANRASTTTYPTLMPSSQTRSMTELKIIQWQVGHRFASTTAIYTGVGGDFMDTMMRKALDRAYRIDREM